MSALNEKAARDLAPGQTLNDTVVRGLSLRAFDERKSFYVFYRTKTGTQRRPKIGDWGSITLTQARAAARQMLAEVALGRDPGAVRMEAKAEPRVSDLWAEFWKRHASKKKSGLEDLRQWGLHLAPRFADMKLSAVTYSNVSDMMDAMKETPYAANRALALLSTMFNFGRRPLEWTARNPTEGVKRYKEAKRERYMRGEETARIVEILDREAAKNPASVVFLYLLILTGARKSEIAAAKWDWVEGNVLKLPDSKTGAKPVYLPPQALDVMARLPRTRGTITGIKSPQKVWERVRVEAGCPDLRIHDLRHSFASAALAAGLSLAQIGELLGHKTAQTTKRYAHLMEEVGVASATAAADRIMGSARMAEAMAE